jgi:hypothetical protein
MAVRQWLFYLLGNQQTAVSPERRRSPHLLGVEGVEGRRVSMCHLFSSLNDFDIF